MLTDQNNVRVMCKARKWAQCGKMLMDPYPLSGLNQTFERGTKVRYEFMCSVSTDPSIVMALDWDRGVDELWLRTRG